MAIGICFWGPARRSGRRVSPEATGAAVPRLAGGAQPLGGSIGRTGHGCQGQRGAHPECRGAHARAGAGPFDQLRAEHRARWRRIFSITVGWSMNAIMRSVLAHRGHTSGSTSYTC